MNCPGGLCARTPDDHWTLDPADGRLSWQRGDGQPWRAIRGSDDQLLVRDLDDQRTLVASEVSRAARRWSARCRRASATAGPARRRSSAGPPSTPTGWGYHLSSP